MVAFYFILLRDISAETLTDLLTNSIRDRAEQTRTDPINKNINNLQTLKILNAVMIISLHKFSIRIVHILQVQAGLRINISVESYRRQ